MVGRVRPRGSRLRLLSGHRFAESEAHSRGKLMPVEVRTEALDVDRLLPLLATGAAEPAVGYTGIYREFNARFPT